MTFVSSLNKNLSFRKYVLSVDMLRYSKKLTEFKDTCIKVLQHRYLKNY